MTWKTLPSSTSNHTTQRSSAEPSRRLRAVESMLLVQRERYVGAGMREDIIVRNFGPEPAAVTIDIEVDADFADLFAVKEGRTRPMSDRSVRVAGPVLEVESATVYARRGLRVRADGAVAYPRAHVVSPCHPGSGRVAHDDRGATRH